MRRKTILILGTVLILTVPLGLSVEPPESSKNQEMITFHLREEDLKFSIDGKGDVRPLSDPGTESVHISKKSDKQTISFHFHNDLYVMKVKTGKLRKVIRVSKMPPKAPWNTNKVI